MGRSVLLEYADYAARNAIAIDPFSSTCIPLDHLQGLVAEERIEFRQGDILFLLSGFTAAYNALSFAE